MSAETTSLRPQVALHLEQGSLFQGLGFGALAPTPPGRAFYGGEIVFNTGMAGYQEIFSDPSYLGQVVVMTSPHQGNTGFNGEDEESARAHPSAVIVRHLTDLPSSWRSRGSLDAYLKAQGIAGVEGVDTRELTRVIRTGGAQRAVVFPCEGLSQQKMRELGSQLLLSVPPMEGQELVSQVSCKQPYEFEELAASPGRLLPLVVVYDFGAKRQILKELKKRNLRVRVVPYNYPHQEVLKLNPGGVVLSNGPGDPACVDLKPVEALVGQLPVLGICMGHQLLGRALGARTYKLVFGHHGVNHPVKSLDSGRVWITSHNHGFSVDREGLSAREAQVTHVSLNDGTVEGMASSKHRFVSVQFHPEAAPGPRDAAPIFDQFLQRCFA